MSNHVRLATWDRMTGIEESVAVHEDRDARSLDLHILICIYTPCLMYIHEGIHGGRIGCHGEGGYEDMDHRYLDLNISEHLQPMLT